MDDGNLVRTHILDLDDIVLTIRRICAPIALSDRTAEQHLLVQSAQEIERTRAEVDLKGCRLDDALDEIERLRALIVEWDDANNFGSLHGDDLTAAVDRLNASEKALIEEARRG